MNCRPGCGACCIAISISSPIPGLPEGKPAGERCVNLTGQNSCSIHGSVNYPAVCRNLTPTKEMCGEGFKHAMEYLSKLEKLTSPDEKKPPVA